MDSNLTLQTERISLGQWRSKDLELFAQFNSDSNVRKFFPGLLSEEESNASAKLFAEHIQKYGWGFWAASLRETDEFIGLIGLQNVYFKAPFNSLIPAVEIGWRLGFNHWGKGYATEGAKAALEYGFKMLKLNEIVSFTASQNRASQRVMEKIGMHHHPVDDFDHPKLTKGHHLSRHVLYRIQKKEWEVVPVIQ